MGAKYVCIVTKEKIEVPIEVPHFYKGDVLTVPVECEGLAVELFMEQFDGGLLNRLKNPVEEDLAVTNDKLNEPKDYQSYIDNPQNIYKLLKKLDLTYKQFLLKYESEWADIPDDYYHAVYENGCMIKETEWISLEKEGTLDAYKYLQINYEDIYWNDYYDLAKDDYEQSIKGDKLN